MAAEARDSGFELLRLVIAPQVVGPPVPVGSRRGRRSTPSRRPSRGGREPRAGSSRPAAALRRSASTCVRNAGRSSRRRSQPPVGAVADRGQARAWPGPRRRRPEVARRPATVATYPARNVRQSQLPCEAAPRPGRRPDARCSRHVIAAARRTAARSANFNASSCAALLPPRPQAPWHQFAFSSSNRASSQTFIASDGVVAQRVHPDELSITCPCIADHSVCASSAALAFERRRCRRALHRGDKVGEGAACASALLLGAGLEVGDRAPNITM